MKQLWAPWRSVYFDEPKDGDCIFCGAHSGALEGGQTLYRGDLSVVMMNRYPYSSGHILIAPARHIGLFEDLTDAEAADSHHLLRLGKEALTKVLKPEGFNIGLNIGRAAGAGITAHLHTHLVPRWNGDCNFMPVLADVKIMPDHIEAIYGRLKPFFAKII